MPRREKPGGRALGPGEGGCRLFCRERSSGEVAEGAAPAVTAAAAAATTLTAPPPAARLAAPLELRLWALERAKKEGPRLRVGKE